METAESGQSFILGAGNINLKSYNSQQHFKKALSSLLK